MKLQKFLKIFTLCLCLMMSSCTFMACGFSPYYEENTEEEEDSETNVYTDFALNYYIQVLESSSGIGLYTDVSFAFLNSSFCSNLSIHDYNSSNKFTYPGNALSIAKSFNENDNFDLAPTMNSQATMSSMLLQGSQLHLGSFHSKLINGKAVVKAIFNFSYIFQATYNPTGYVYNITNDNNIYFNDSIWINDSILDNQPYKNSNTVYAREIWPIASSSAPKIFLIALLSLS